MLQRKFKYCIAVSIALCSFILISANRNDETPEQKVKLYFARQLDTMEQQIIEYKQLVSTGTEKEIRTGFENCRLSYKKIEFLAEYYYPGAAARINGAPLLEAEPSEPEEPVHPTGFQVLEETVYEDLTPESRLLMVNEISSLSYQVRKLKTYLDDMEPDAIAIFDALRLNVYRMIAKGLSGFDSPAALNNIPEAGITLSSMKVILSYYEAKPALENRLNAAIAFTKSNPDFNSFDRAIFISAYVNPLLQELYNFQLAKNIPFVNSSRAVSTSAPHLFSKDAYDMYYFAPSGTMPSSNAMIALGEKLFNEPLLSANGNRSCASCHNPAKAFTDGLPVNTSLFGNKQLSRNTPTLINSALQLVQFADSRITFLEDQVHAVVSNPHEMGGEFSKIVSAIKAKKEYKKLFGAAYDNKSTEAAIKAALAAYVRSLTSLNSRFDAYMRGNADAMNAEEVQGFNLFMSKGKCGTCHYVPLFSGAVPPLYDKMESEVLGVPATTDTLHPVLDTDSGKYHLYKMPHQLFSFKTPGLRNIALTAPYMHNGVYKTLEEVIDFYEKGGGAGLGFDIPSQTLAPDKLGLTPAEKKALIAFMHTLTDTSFTRARQRTDP